MNAPNFSPEQMLKLLMNTGGKTKDSSMAEDLVKNKLSPEQQKRLEGILSDKTAVDKILSSPQAKELLKKLGGEKR